MAAAEITMLRGASGGGFEVRAQSGYAQGSSFAGVAAGGRLSSMFWNPANLSAVEKIEVEGNATVIAPIFDVKLDPFA